MDVHVSLSEPPTPSFTHTHTDAVSPFSGAQKEHSPGMPSPAQQRSEGTGEGDKGGDGAQEILGGREDLWPY